MKLTLDTNVFIFTFLDLAEKRETPRTKIFRSLLDKTHRLVLSDELEKQILNVVGRVKDKNFVGLFRHMVWTDFSIDYATIEKHEDLVEKWKGKVPRKDLDVFVTAIAGGADVLISEGESFVKKAGKVSNEPEVMKPEEFWKKYGNESRRD